MKVGGGHHSFSLCVCMRDEQRGRGEGMLDPLSSEVKHKYTMNPLLFADKGHTFSTARERGGEEGEINLDPLDQTLGKKKIT